MSAPKITPMLKQYLSVKEQYEDAILFYRMGDFYEMFFEDARKASRALDITLTSRNKKDENPIPMCGVPCKAAKAYLSRLIEQGFRVAICDQVEDPAASKGLVKREVVRVVTPGMIIEDELLDGKSNNYILALAIEGKQAGLACLDISTGTFRVVETADHPALLDEARRIAPREVLLPASAEKNNSFQPLINLFSETAVTFIDDSAFRYKKSREALCRQFGTFSLEGFGCEHLKAGVSAAGAVLYYIRETQKQDITHLAGIETYFLDDTLIIDALSCRNLELVKNIHSGTRKGTLLDVVDMTVTTLGGRLLNRWLRYPLIDPERINARHIAVEESLKGLGVTRELRSQLANIHDLERLTSKISMGHANARDLTALKQSLVALPGILAALDSFESHLFRWQADTTVFDELAALIENAIREDAPLVIHEGGMIKTGYSRELDELITISREGKGWLVQLEAREKADTGINSLKVRYNRVFGYYIEIPKTHTDAAPGHYVRKQTLVNAERYITDELKTFETRVLNADEKRSTLEYELFNDIRSRVTAKTRELQAIARFLARVDCLLGFAEIADRNDYRRPKINTEGRIEIDQGRHPVIEKMITGERFVPNSIRLDDQADQVLVITGPNMAGKSTILRQVALTVLMAQAGSFVPAGQADINVTDRIFTRVGALDNLAQGQSTFMVEMQETANILNSATNRSLIIMDEIGRGTSTFDGLSIAWAVAEYLHDYRDNGVKTLFATHYHELTELAKIKKRVKNYNIAVKEWNDEIIFLRKLVAGGTNRSYGIQVARLAGVPLKVIDKAKKILFEIENEAGHLKNAGRNASPSAGPEEGQQQLNLFLPPENAIVRDLRSMDISNTTPLEALTLLSQLQERVKKTKT
ncbi:MAG: DNA mismatch repair protein MutS [Desulfobacterales bacterium]|nr:DNA mismatch repair protein MutS [Desulfobacterales bacterium]